MRTDFDWKTCKKCKDYVHWVRHKKKRRVGLGAEGRCWRQLDKLPELRFHHEDVRWKLTSHCSNEGKEPIGKCSTIFDRLWAKNLSILCSFAHHQATASQRKIRKLCSADLMNRVHEIDIKGSPTKKHTKLIHFSHWHSDNYNDLGSCLKHCNVGCFQWT